MALKWYLVFIVAVFYSVQFVEGGGTISVKLLKYTNPSHTLKDNTCCDGTLGNNQDCSAPCDNIVFLWIGESRSRSDKIFSWSSNSSISSDNITFASLDKPFMVKFDRWKGILCFLTSVRKKSTINFIFSANDCKEYNASSHGRATSNLVEFIKGDVKDGFDYRKTFTLEVKIDCNENYWPPYCTKYCESRDDKTGHYGCSDTGEKQCLPGWLDPSKNCTVKYCKPTHDIKGGHYRCNSMGDKICLYGWTNPLKNCTVRYCKPPVSPFQHFRCKDGEKVCLPGWMNPDLDCMARYCKPTDDEFGHYNCSEMGKKICLEGWKDPDYKCTTRVCEPRDDEKGHYKCGMLGVKVCLPGWVDKSKNCLVKYCKESNDDIAGHYTCSEMGEKICRDGYEQPDKDCKVKVCAGQNDDTNGHYSCTEKGEIRCLPGWVDESANCTIRFCEPQDGTGGHYTCTKEGNKVCRDGWRNSQSNCTEEIKTGQTASSKKSNTLTYVAYGVGPVIAFILIVVVVVFILKRRRNQATEIDDQVPLKKNQPTDSDTDYGSRNENGDQSKAVNV